MVLTPRLKAHSRRIVDNFADGTNPCIKELQPIPVSNLSKRFSSANLGTPTRILQLALEKKSGNESHDHETTADEQPTSNSGTHEYMKFHYLWQFLMKIFHLDTENEAGYSKNEVPIKQPAAGSRKKFRC